VARQYLPGVKLALLSLTVALLGLAIGRAHDEDLPPPAQGSVRLSFVPPPMEGTISLGVYDAAGKLVRVLHRDADAEIFLKGLNGLVTDWDGRGSDSNRLPAGKYSARGFAVGEWDIEGEAFYGNDWIDAGDAVPIRRIEKLVSVDAAGLTIVARANDQEVSLRANAEKIEPSQETAPQITPAPQEGVAKWFVAAIDGRSEVRATRGDELWRRLSIDPKEPQPVQVIASADGNVVALLEEKTGMQRVRVLTLAEPDTDGRGESKWHVDWERSIAPAPDLESGRALLSAAKATPLPDAEPVAIRLVPNPLDPDGDRSLIIHAVIDEEGCWLAAADGLPLRQISEKRGLRWAAVEQAPGQKTLTVWQGDGVVIERFTVGRTASMMSFDCGEFDLPAE
jgi:hypothetical protein